MKQTSNLLSGIRQLFKRLTNSKDDVQARKDLEYIYDLSGLRHMTNTVAAARVLVEQYRRAKPGTSLEEIEAAVALKRNGTFNLHIAEVTREYIKGTEAEQLANMINGCKFKVADGVLIPQSEAWRQHVQGLGDMLNMYFNAPLDIQTDNVYRCLIQSSPEELRARWHSSSHLSCAPSHLDEGIFNSLCGDMNWQFEQTNWHPNSRLYSAFALIWFGVIDALNDSTSLLYSPEKFIQILVHCDLVDMADQERKVNCYAVSGACHA